MRRHLSFANVAATLALVLAMSGGAYAAKHYLIASSTHCPGRGQAEQGFLCIYQGFAENAEAPNDENVFDPETSAGTDEAAGSRGFAIFLESKKGGLTTITGSYAVTAP